MSVGLVVQCRCEERCNSTRVRCFYACPAWACSHGPAWRADGYGVSVCVCVCSATIANPFFKRKADGTIVKVGLLHTSPASKGPAALAPVAIACKRIYWVLMNAFVRC